MAPARPGGDLRMMSPTEPAETRQGDGAPLKTEASVENHGPHAAGRRLEDDVSDRTGGDPHRQQRAPEYEGQHWEPRPLG